MLCSPSVLWILTCIFRGLVVWLSKQHQNGHVYGDPTLYRIGLAISVPVLPISDAVHCNRLCSALHPSSQCTASSMLVLATFPASTCIRPRKYVQPSPQVRASVLASTSEIGSFRNLPRVFLLSPVFLVRPPTLP